MTPESSLLLLCARPRALAAGRPTLVDAAAAVADWDSFVGLAGRHGMLPLVAKLDHESSFLPKSVSAWLAELYKANAGRVLRFSAVLLAIAEALAVRGVKALPLKGSVLAQEVYGDLVLRQLADLDLLVPPESLADAIATLEQSGYRPLFAPDATGGHRLRGARHDVIFQHPASRIPVELHWRLARERDALRLSARRVFGRARTVSFLEREVLFPDAVDLFVYLVVHAANHGWASLENLRCLGEIVTRHPEIDWDAVLRMAKDVGALRRCHVAVLLLADAFGLTWEESILGGARADKQAVQVAAAAPSAWAAAVSPSPGELRPAVRRMLSLDDARAQARYAASILFEPDEVDTSAVHLPPRLYPLYYVVRPVRLTALYGRRALRKAAGWRKGR